VANPRDARGDPMPNPPREIGDYDEREHVLVEQLRANLADTFSAFIAMACIRFLVSLR
jgi:hypothetical protein